MVRIRSARLSTPMGFFPLHHKEPLDVGIMEAWPWLLQADGWGHRCGGAVHDGASGFPKGLMHFPAPNAGVCAGRSRCPGRPGRGPGSRPLSRTIRFLVLIFPHQPTLVITHRQAKEADESMACVQHTNQCLVYGSDPLRAKQAALRATKPPPCRYCMISSSKGPPPAGGWPQRLDRQHRGPGLTWWSDQQRVQGILPSCP